MVISKVVVKLDVVGVVPHTRFNLYLFPIEGMVSDGMIVVHVITGRGMYVVVMSAVETGGVRVWGGGGVGFCTGSY